MAYSRQHAFQEHTVMPGWTHSLWLHRLLAPPFPWLHTATGEELRIYSQYKLVELQRESIY